MSFSIQDQNALANWIGGGASLGDVLSASSIGIVGNVRFTERARRRYVAIWTWSAYRMGGIYAAKQDRFWNLHGKVAFERRMARAQTLARAYGWKG